jgi:hypothetical protein
LINQEKKREEIKRYENRCFSAIAPKKNEKRINLLNIKYLSQNEFIKRGRESRMKRGLLMSAATTT